MRKTAVVATGVLGLAVLGFLLWLALREEPEEPPPAGEFRTGELDPLAQRHAVMSRPWPFADFEKDISELKAPASLDGGFDPDVKRNQNENAIYFTRFSLDMKDVHPSEVVKELATRFKDSGVRIFTLDPPVPDHVRVTVGGPDVTITDIIDQIRSQTNEECRYFMTWQGLCIGTQHAIEQAQLDANAAAGAMKARSDPPSKVLDLEYRPGLSGAPIANVARDIREQTGVDVVVDSDLWSHPKTLTWRDAPMPLRQALERICKEYGAYHRVRDGRVFLLKP